MPGSVFLEGEGVTLQTIEKDDIDFFRDLWNDVEIRVFGGGPSGPFNTESMESYYKNDICDDNSTNLLICTESTPVGVISLTSVDHWADTAELGYIVAPDAQRKGYATEASRLVMEHAFTQLGLHKLVATIFEFNEPSIGLIEKLGFTEEGIHRDERFANGEYADVHYYGLLDDEWCTNR